MKNEDKNVPENNKREGRKPYLEGFTTGFLAAVLAAMLAVRGPSLYRTYIKHETDPKVKAQAIYDLMEEYYIDDIDKEKMYEGIYYGMTSIPTDKYSYYMSSEDAEAYNTRTDGNYVGIGIVIGGDSKTKNIVVNTVYDPSPAKDIGIKKGDILRAAAGVDVSTDNYDDVVGLVRGPEGTTEDLVIYRPSEDKEMNLTCERRHVDVNTVFGRMLDDETGYIRIEAFDGVTPDQFRAELTNLTSDGMKRMVIDLRNNPGGLLTAVKEISDMLIPEGLFTYTEDKNGEKEYYYVDDDYLGMPLAVLVNGSSASASELMSGAVKDTGVGTLVGEKTYGKGVVQTPFTLKDGSIVKLTTSRYYTPAGICVDGVGIEPDITIAPEDGFEMPELFDKNTEIDMEKDVQLKKAYEVVKEK